MNKIKIIIADSHFLSRKGLLVFLNESVDFTCISEAISASDLVNQAKFYTPDLIIIDYTSQNFSLDSIPQIVKKYPTSKLLAISIYQGMATSVGSKPYEGSGISILFEFIVGIVKIVI